MELTEQDFIDKMVEIAHDGYEYIDQLKCVFFTWYEFFCDKENTQDAADLASRIFEESGCEREEEYVNELLSIII